MHADSLGEIEQKVQGERERAHATGVTFDGRREALPVGPRARVWWQNHRRGKYPFDAGYKKTSKEQFEGAFPSKNNEGNIQRGGRRPRRGGLGVHLEIRQP